MAVRPNPPRRSSVAEVAEAGGGKGLNAGFEGGVQDGRELGAVVGGDVLGDPAGLRGPMVDARVGAADVPEQRGDFPFLTEQAEVLTDGERIGELGYAVGPEVGAERVADLVSRCGVVDRKVEVVEEGETGGFRRPGSSCLKQ